VIADSVRIGVNVWKTGTSRFDFAQYRKGDGLQSTANRRGRKPGDPTPMKRLTSIFAIILTI